MVYVYGDLSGTADSKVLAAGCYLGRKHQWDAAVAEWTKVLRDAQVKEFHATDFFSGFGEFAGDEWNPKGEKHREYAARFTAVASDAGLIGFAFAMDCAAFSSVLAPELKKEKRKYRSTHPRTYSTFSSVARVAQFLEKANHPATERVQIVFEHEQGAGRFSDFFEESRKRRERWTYWFDGFTTADKSLVPLQIADLLAHEAWRRVKAIMADPAAKLRKSFERMLIHGDIEVGLLDEASCNKNAEMVRDVLVHFPNGLAPPG